MIKQIAIQDIPDGIIKEMLFYLSPNDFINFLSISKRYYNIIFYSDAYQKFNLIHKGVGLAIREKLRIPVSIYQKPFFPQLIEYVKNMPDTVNDCLPYAANLDGYTEFCQRQLYNIKRLNASDSENSLIEQFTSFFLDFIGYVTKVLKITMSNSALQKLENSDYVKEFIKEAIQDVSSCRHPFSSFDIKQPEQSDIHYKKIFILLKNILGRILTHIKLKEEEIAINYLLLNHMILIFILTNNFSKKELETIIDSLEFMYTTLNGNQLMEDFAEISNFLGIFSSLNAEIKKDFWKLLSQDEVAEKLETVYHIMLDKEVQKDSIPKLDFIFSIKLLIVKKIMIKEHKDVRFYLSDNQIKVLNNKKRSKHCQGFYSDKDLINTFIVFLRILNVIPLKNISLYPNLFTLISLALNKATDEQLYCYDSLSCSFISIMRNDGFLKFIPQSAQNEKNTYKRDSYQLNFYRFLKELFALPHATFDFSRMVLSIFYALGCIISALKAENVYAEHQAMLSFGIPDIINLLRSPEAIIPLDSTTENANNSSIWTSAMFIKMYVEYHFINKNPPLISLSSKMQEFLNKNSTNFAFYLALARHFSSTFNFSFISEKTHKFFEFLNQHDFIIRGLEGASDINTIEGILIRLRNIGDMRDKESGMYKKIKELEESKVAILEQIALLKQQGSTNRDKLISLYKSLEVCKREINELHASFENQKKQELKKNIIKFCSLPAANGTQSFTSAPLPQPPSQKKETSTTMQSRLQLVTPQVKKRAAPLSLFMPPPAPGSSTSPSQNLTFKRPLDNLGKDGKSREEKGTTSYKAQKKR